MNLLPFCSCGILGVCPSLLSADRKTCQVNSEKGLVILSWRKGVASEKGQMHNKVWIKLRVTQVTL